MKLLVKPEGSNIAQSNLCERLIAHLGVDYVPTHIILDSDDYSDNSSVLDEFRDIAFSWTPDRPKDRVPPYLFKVMNDSSCTHLVWLSRKALTYSDPLFVWVLAHELRHLYQSKHGFPKKCIQDKVNELRKRAEYISLRPSLFEPEEIDSELFGLRSATAMYSVEQLEGISLPRCPDPNYLKLLQEVAYVCPT
jgi:hypothetical protein